MFQRFEGSMTRNILIVLGLVLIIGASLTVNVNGSRVTPNDWPSDVSGLDGWNGLRLSKGIRCPECYSLVIPKEFGLKNEADLRILAELPKKKVDGSLNYDLDGPFFIDSDVLDHLLSLAVNKGSLAAGRIILDPEKYGLLIGAETSEDIEGAHVIPLIRSFRDLNSLIEGEGEYNRVARNICNWSVMNADFRAVNSLITALMTRQNHLFVRVLSSTCMAEKKFMKEHGEEFIE
jgi:hypothetical protein